MQHILEPVFDDEDRAFFVPRQIVDELNGCLAHLRIERRERLVEYQNTDIAAEHARDRHLLFLTTGKIKRHRRKEVLHSRGRRMLLHDRHHFAAGSCFVFHGKGDVLRHG